MKWKKYRTWQESLAKNYLKKGFLKINVSTFQQEDKKYLQFCIEDSGIGIKKEDLPKLFQKFGKIEQNKVGRNR